MKQGLSNIIDKIADIKGKHWLEKSLNGLQPEKRIPYFVENVFHPSWAGMCPRYIQYIYLGIVTQEAEDARVERIFDVGHHTHIRYKNYFERLGILIGTEVGVDIKLPENLFIKGRADFLLKSMEGERIVVELKSINNNAFEKLRAPVDEHFLQWNVYAQELSLEGIILYENKNNQHFKVFPVSFVQTKFDYVVNIFRQVRDCSQKGILVFKPEKCPNAYCKGKVLCKEGKKESNEFKLEFKNKKE